MKNLNTVPTDPEAAELIENASSNTPQEAVKVINRAEHYEMHPDNYNSMKKTLDPKAEMEESIPPEIDPVLKNYASQSSNHARVVGNEPSALNKLGNKISFMWYNAVTKRPLENEIFELDYEDMMSDDGLDNERKEYLNSLKELRQQDVESFNLTDDEQIPGHVAGVVGDLVEAAYDNPAIIGGATSVGAGVGAFTPLGPATALAGAGAGLAFGTTAAMVKRAYERVSASTYSELDNMIGEDGQPLNLPKDVKSNIAIGVGLSSAALEAVTGATLSFGLGKLVSSSAKKAALHVVKNTSLKTAMNVFGHGLKSAGISGAEEVSADIVALLGKNFAKTYGEDGEASEDGFINALYETIDQIKNDPEVQKQLKMTAKIGAFAGGGIATFTGAVVSPKVKKSLDQRNAEIEIIKKQEAENLIIQSALDSLTNQEDVTQLSKMSNETQLKKMSPKEISNLRKSMFEQAGHENYFFSEVDLTTIEGKDPILAARIREMDVSEASNNDTKSHVAIEPHVFMDLVDDVPTVSEWARMNPEGPNPLESRNLLERFTTAQKQRQEIFESLGVGEELSPDQIAILEGLDKTVEEGTRAAGEQGYINDAITFTESIEGVIPEEKAKRFNDAQLKAREAVAAQLNEEFENRERLIENRVVKANEKIIKEEQERVLKNDLRIVEEFRYDKTNPVEAHKKKGYSKLAIDPKYLPNDLREAYLADPMLKKRKVFVEGGISLKESASLAGVPTGEQLLKTLANTPTNKELLIIRKKKAAEIRKQVKESRSKGKENRRDKIFNDLQKAHRKEMEFMKEHKWTDTKGGIKNVVLPLPKIAEMNHDAKGIVKRTKVGALNVRQFNASEKSLQKKAANHILKNEVEQAFVAKEKAMMNTELTREALRARVAINEAKEIVKRVTSRKGRRTIKKAGLTEQVAGILDLFDLRSSKPKGMRQDSYYQYLASLDKEGKSIVLPDDAPTDIRQSGTDLTVEQYLRITERLQTLEHQAIFKNKLFREQKKRAEMKKLQTVEAIVVDAANDLKNNHPNYNEKRLRGAKNKNSKSVLDGVREFGGLVNAANTNMKNVAVELDQEALLGQHAENIAQPMVEGETDKRTRLSEIVGHIKTIANDYGVKKFTDAFNDFQSIPEFNGFEELGDGTVARSDLWTLLMFLGDPQARERIANFKHITTKESMDIDTVQQVLDRVLTEADAKLAQNFTNIFKSFTEEAKALHERTTGVTPNMVKGVPITHRGKVLDGGYVPNSYLNTSRTEKLDRFLEAMGEKVLSMFGSKKDGKLYSTLRASEMTDQGRLMDRNGSSKPLDINFGRILEGYEEHAHDLAYRERGSDVLKLLRNPVYSDAIISTVGLAKYNTMVNGVIETVGKYNADDTLSPFSKEINALGGVYNWLEQGFNISRLGGNLTSIAMQPLSTIAASLRMGPTGGRYLVKATGEAIKHIGTRKYNEMFETARQINPDIGTNMDSIDDTLVKSTYGDVIPKTKNAGKHSIKIAALKRAQQWMVDFSMSGLRKLDIHLKVITTIAASNQFLDGNVKNFPQSKLDTMSDAEIEVATKKYAKQVADLALTTSADIDKTAAEKIKFMRIVTRFYTDVRAQRNTMLSQIRKIEFSGKRAAADFREGRTNEGLSHVKSGAVDLGSLMAAYMLHQMYTDTLRGEDTPISELGSVNSFSDFGNYMGNTVSYGLLAAPKGLVGSTLIAKDIDFALGSTARNKKVNFPLTQVFTDMTMTISGLADMIEGRNMSKKQKKALLYTASYGLKGIPVNGPLKIAKMVKESEIYGDVGAFIRGETNRLAKAIGEYVRQNKDDPEEQDNIEAMKELQQDLVPALEQETKHIIPDDAMEVLKTAEWDEVNPTTGAAGVYQFTEEAWDDISEEDPTLGLTDAGRTSKDAREQEKAMNWELDRNTKGLIAYQIEVNNSTLFGAHRFGLDDFVAVSLAEPSDKLSDIVLDKKLFEGFETVRQVRNFIKKQVKPIDNENP